MQGSQGPPGLDGVAGQPGPAGPPQGPPGVDGAAGPSALVDALALRVAFLERLVMASLFTNVHQEPALGSRSRAQSSPPTVGSASGEDSSDGSFQMS